MKETLYRIFVDEESYFHTQDQYDAYAKSVTEHNARYPQWPTALQSPEKLRETHIQNAWNAVFDKRYKDIKPAQRYIKSMKKHYDGILEFYVVIAEIEWKPV